MPRTYLTSAERQQTRIQKMIAGWASGKTEQLAKAWELTPQAVNARIRTGNVTLLDLWKAREVFQFDLMDIEYLIGGGKEK